MSRPVVVIGGGIVGASVALHLVDRDVPTILVERDSVPQGASAFSFASISAFDEPARDAYVLKCHGMVSWHRFGRRLEADVGLRWSGEIRWAEGAMAAGELLKKVERAHHRGYPLWRLSETELRRRLPQSRPGSVAAACFAPEDGQVDPLKAISAIRAAFEQAGGRSILGRAGLRFEDAALEDSGVEVRVANERINAAAVVLAAGSETMAFANSLGWDIPMEASPGFLVLTTPTGVVAKETVYVSTPSGPPVHLRQLDDGRVLIGEHSQDHVAGDPSERHAKQLLRQAARSFPVLLDAEVERFVVEWRPMPRDRNPIVGPVPGVPCVYVAAAHSGVTLAPAIGELVAGEIAERKPTTRLEPFRPARFAAHAADVTKSIEDAFSSSELFLG